MRNNIILVGGGGHCRSCIDVIEAEHRYLIDGVVDREDYIGKSILDYSVKWTDGDLESLIADNNFFLITLGSVKDPSRRVKIFEYLKKNGAKCAVVISPLAHVSKYAQVGQGTIVLHRAVVNASSRVGENGIINTSSLIEHDVRIGNHVHVSTASIINGTCHIGDRVFIGSNSVISHNVTICDDVVIGAGSVVIKSIAEPGVYVGNPARKVKSNE